MNFFENKTDVVEFVEDLLSSLKLISVSITITPQGKYVVSYAPTVIGELSNDTDEKKVLSFFATQSNT